MDLPIIGDNINKNLLYKICLGEATENEKKEWNETTNFSKEINDKLMECCNMGYEIAAKLDSNSNDSDVQETLKKLTQDVEDIKKKVDFLMSKV